MNSSATPEGPGSVSGAPHLPDGFTATFTSRYIDTAGLRQHVVTGGEGPPLLLVHGWPQTWYAWRLVMPALARDFTIVAPDQRGTGLSGKPAGGYDTGTLAGDLVALMDVRGHRRFAVAGHDTGMWIGYALAADHPDRVARLAVVCSSARFGEPEGWRDRAALVRERGTGPLLEVAAERWFTGPFRAAGAPLVAELVDDLRTAEPAGYAACCDALAGFDVREELPRIAAPTLVIAGREDPATPPAHSRLLADGIADCALLEVPHAAHLAPAEQPERVGAALAAHFAPDPAAESGAPSGAGDAGAAGMDAAGMDVHAAGMDVHAAGMKVRRAVLGDAHVDRAVANTTPFTADFQDFIARYAWGEIWARPGLDRRTRSVITLTALVAHGHHAELAMHLRGALNNGLTRDEIKEVLLQSAVYCGVPAANSAFAVAQRVLDELDRAEGSSCAPQ